MPEGTGSLLRLALRRDRVLLPAWLLTLVLTAASSASAVKGLYPTLAHREVAAAAFNASPPLVALYGRIYDPGSLGALAMIKMGGVGAILVAALAIVVVVRHTRAEEESGRLELLVSTAVGRQAPLAAALAVAAGTNGALALLTALALLAAGLPSAGSIAFGLSWGAAGLAFAAIAAVVAQLTTSARSARGISGAVLGFAYLLRAAGDASGPRGFYWLSWLSPVGWAQQLRPFAGESWKVLLLFVVFTAAVALVAMALAFRRDLGAGLLADRAGREAASRWLGSPLVLAWRLHRASLLGWSASFLMLGALLGGIASGVEGLLSAPGAIDLIQRLGGEKALSDAFLAAELGFVGILASAYGIAAALRVRSEETALHAEALLATATSRTRWVSSHLAVALLGATALLLTAGLGAGTAHALQTSDGTQVGRVLVAALAQAPAAWVLTGITTAAFGVAPQFSTAGWAALVLFLLIGEIGPLFRLHQWVLDISPFAHIPKLPGAPFSVIPLAWLTLVAAALTAIGLLGFRQRDVG